MNKVNRQDAENAIVPTSPGKRVFTGSSLLLELFLHVEKLEKRIKRMKGTIACLCTEIESLRGPSSDILSQYRPTDPKDPHAWEPIRERD